MSSAPHPQCPKCGSTDVAVFPIDGDHRPHYYASQCIPCGAMFTLRAEEVESNGEKISPE